MITVGLDFGTHQSKVCIEKKERAVLEYSFLKFRDCTGHYQYTLPSIISIQPDGKLRYGYIPYNDKGRIVRYFKQATFNDNSSSILSQKDAFFYSTLYLAFILFDLEEKYGQNFVIQMGAPTDSGHLSLAKQIAVRILSTAYTLVEDLFDGNKEEFLDQTIDDLRAVAEIREYSDFDKDSFGILIFPEAYACLNPLLSQKKVSEGMSVMLDIGGGTTDVSFFTIEDNTPQVYDFFSINYGLNYLTDSDPEDNIRKNSKVIQSDLKDYRTQKYTYIISNRIRDLYQRVLNNFKINTRFNVARIKAALKDRPIIFCGGGSTFSCLRQGYLGFTDKHLISEREWKINSVLDMPEIIKKNLCPILSTAYGLAIHRVSDDIKTKPFSDLFMQMGLYEEDTTHPMSKSYRRPSSFGSAIGGVAYEDYDSYK